MNSARIAATAQRLLTKNGQAVTLTRNTPGAYDPGTGTATPAGTATYGGKGVALNYAQRDIDGTAIRQGDQRVYIGPALAVTPQTGDTLTLGTTVFTVVASRPLAPAGVVLLHDVQVRGV